MNDQKAIAILIEAAGVAQASGKLKLEDAALIVQAIGFLKMGGNAAQAKPADTKKSNATEVAPATAPTEPENGAEELEA